MKHIPLTQGQFAIVDDDMYEYLNQWKWHALRSKYTYYAVRSQSCYIDGRKTWRQIYMHRIIMQAPQGRDIDHRKHNGLDNRRCKLRECSRSENLHNQIPRKTGASRYKGVYWEKERGKWVARIRYTGKLRYIGRYDLETVAAKAYDEKAKELFGEFVCTNF